MLQDPWSRAGGDGYQIAKLLSDLSAKYKITAACEPLFQTCRGRGNLSNSALQPVIQLSTSAMKHHGRGA